MSNTPNRNFFQTFLPVIWATLLLALPAGAGPLPDSWRSDTNLFPKAYGILAEEHLMSPVDMSNWPVKIDSSRQLFVDDYLIAAMTNLTRQVHQVKRHPANPFIVPDKPWEGVGCMFHIIRRDEKTGRWRMWYAGYPGYHALYAESEDGIKWIKPELGLHDYKGSKNNNIIILEGNLWGIFYEPEDPDPNRRYKGLVMLYRNQPNEGYYLYISPDGIHWTRAREEAVAWSQHKYTMPTSGIGDTTTFR